MVNRLMRNRTQRSQRRVLVHAHNCPIPEATGPVVLSTGVWAWVGWEDAKRLRDEGKLTIEEYEKSFIEEVRAEQAAGTDLSEAYKREIPGFICQECLAEGSFTVYAKKFDHRVHVLNVHDLPNRPKEEWPPWKPAVKRSRSRPKSHKIGRPKKVC